MGKDGYSYIFDGKKGVSTFFIMFLVVINGEMEMCYVLVFDKK